MLCRLFSDKDMSLQTCSLIVCVFLAQMAAGTGVQFVMERHPDNYFCGHLQCLADFTHTDHDVFTFVEMTIYDITRVDSELRLASVSTFDPDLYVDTTKSSAVGCTGTISRLKANLTLQLRHDIDCLYAVYKCQLDLVTVSGHSEVLTEIVTPEYNHSYSRIAEVLSHFDRLTQLLNSFTILMNNQTAQINRLASQSDDQTAQMVNQTILLIQLARQTDDQTAHLVNHTAQLNKFTSQSDDQTAQLVNQSAHLNRLTSQLGDQTVQINRLANLSVDKTAQLVDQTAHLHNISERCDLDLAVQKQRHEAAENRLKVLQEKLDKVDQPLLYSCYRGMPYKNAREKFLLAGKVLALCDTETDGGGWVIIQRRVRGDVDFYRRWNDYKRGFGTPDTDLWIGNDIIHDLTSQGYNELRIDFVYNGTNYFAKYTNFRVADESSNYRITISGFSGNVYDSMEIHNDMSFSTPDRDNDLLVDSGSCSMKFHGAWWYNSCYKVNLNGAWAQTDETGIAWHFTSTSTDSLKTLTFTEMKIR